MTDTTAASTSPAPRKRFGWLKLLGGAVAILAALVIVAYLVATSSGFFKGFILPKVGKAINSEVTVSEASIHPFSSVSLRDLKVKPNGAETLLTADEVRLAYSLFDIMRGKINVDEVTVTAPTVTLSENADGSSNLDPILKSLQAEAKETAPAKAPGQPSKPMQLNVKKVALTGGTLRRTKTYDASHKDVAEISKLGFVLENLQNAQTANLKLDAEVLVQNSRPSPGTNGVVGAKLTGGFELGLSADLKPGAVKGKLRCEVSRAEGSFAGAAGTAGEVNCDMTPAEIKEAGLRLLKGATELGQIRVSGPFSIEKNEGRLLVELLGVDKRLLGLAGGAAGLDFRDTSISSTNDIQLLQSGKVISAGGQLNVNKLQVARTNQVTPVLDLRVAYNVVVDTLKSNAVIKGLTVTGAQSGNALLTGELTSPMPINWGGSAEAIGDSDFTLRLAGLDLAAWKAFLGEAIGSGTVSSELKVRSQGAGKNLAFDLKGSAENLAVAAGTNRIVGLAVAAEAKGAATDLKKFSLAQSRLQLARAGEPMLTLTASGDYATESQAADVSFTMEAALKALSQLIPQPDVNIASGTAQMNGRLTQKQGAQNLTGGFKLASFSGKVGANTFSDFAASGDLDLGLTPQEIRLGKLAGTLASAGAPGGGFELNATVTRSNNAARFAGTLRDLNQNGLRPFLESAFAGKKLVSIDLNGTASGSYDPLGRSAVTSDLSVTNLVVEDPQKTGAPAKLEARIQSDIGLEKNVLDIRQLRFGVTPTAQASNVVQVTGRIDMSRTNEIQGNVSLLADALDLTSYYDLFAGATNAPAQQRPSPGQPPAGAPSKEGQASEPGPTILPLKAFTAEAKVGRFYLHEVQITNLNTVVKIDGGKVTVKPFSLVLNGAPIDSTVDLDLGIQGYKYDLAFRANQIPLAPLVNTFQPARRGQVGGTLSGEAQVHGIGTTGASLQKNLAGDFDIGSTNLNLDIQTLRSPLLKGLINVIAVVPDITKNPNAAIGTLAGALFGGGSSRANLWTDELKKSPIDVIQARGTMGTGKVELERMLVQSSAFQAAAHGTVTLQSELTNSTLAIPLNISIKRSLAETINMVPPGTPTNAPYAKLPDYVSVTGTVGVPDYKINKTALLGTVLQQFGGSVPGVDKKAGQLLQGLGGMLVGPGGNTNLPSANTTNQPKSAASGLLQGLGGLLGSPQATNAPKGATNQPPATNASPAGSLLNQLLRPKK